MTILTEGQHAGEFIVSEANGRRSREVVTVLLGQNLKAGHVIGLATLGAGSAVAGGSNTGDGTMGAITVGGDAQVGDYVLTITEAAANAGAFQVVDPQGDVVGLGNVAAAFSGGGLAFTLADGATDFAVGDTFTITVAAGSGKAKEWNPANTDGSQFVYGVLFDNVDASTADKPGVIIRRDAEVTAAELQWFSGANASQIATGTAGLAALTILAR
jgi:hypothetical protein